MSKRQKQSSNEKPGEKSGPKMSHREFTEKAIKSLRTPPYKGIHVVYSGFNGAFRQYFAEEPRPVIDALVAEGFLVSQIARGGVIIALASDAETMRSSPSDALAKILTNTI